jgi:deoxyribose-phosphate aldolase
MEPSEVAARIDHTILGAEATKEEVKAKCKEALEYQFASVCVNPAFVELVADELAGSDVKVCTVIGFPLGESTSETKNFEARDAVNNGADELDMVLNLGALKSNNWEVVQEDIEVVVKGAQDKTVKVIIETCYLTDEEKRKACQVIKEAGADFVKTSTGFGTAGAQIEDIRLLKKEVGDDLKIKASGGIGTFDKAVEMIEAGADRIGASSGVEIVTGGEASGDY